jgi:hypothetical protein
VKEDLFVYEEAEKLLDAFAAGPRPMAFKRAYVKFKFMIAAYAYIDFSTPGRRPSGKELAYAWEDVQMAFVGHGEQALIGTIIQLWVTLSPEDQFLFAQVIKEAFGRAEVATIESASRRYLHRYRVKPVRLPEEGFDLPTILPVRGVQLRDWAIDSGQDPDQAEEQWYWLEFADREILRERRSGGQRLKSRKPRLKLVKESE